MFSKSQNLHYLPFYKILPKTKLRIFSITVNEFSKKFDMKPLWTKIMLRKRFVTECINDILKNTAKLALA